MLELGFDELIDFAEMWKASDESSHDAIRACFAWAEKNEMSVDLVHRGRSGWGLQIALRDSAGPFFAEPVLMRANMDVEGKFRRAITQARSARIIKTTNRQLAARAA